MTTSKTLIADLRKELIHHSSPDVQQSVSRFFKEEISSYGVKIPAARELGKKYFLQIKPNGKQEVYHYCEFLFKSGMQEEVIIAIHWLTLCQKEWERKDIDLFIRWSNQYIHNWATCDTIAVTVIGKMILLYPEFVSELNCWTKSKNRWMRRMSAVAMIPSVRKGKNINDAMSIAEKFMNDKDEMVQKGYAWMLKEGCKSSEEIIFDFIFQYKKQMTSIALRIAMEKLSRTQRDLLKNA